MTRFEHALSHLERYEQAHLLDKYLELGESDRQKLLEQVESLDLALMRELYTQSQVEVSINRIVSPIIPHKKSALGSEICALGSEIFARGQVALVTLAGGNGTRLGHASPKGTFKLPLATPKSLFEIIAEQLKSVSSSITWCIMTNEDNHDETMGFFRESDYFGYDRDNIEFFVQSQLPVLESDGKIRMKKSSIEYAPSGNGAVFETLEHSGMLSRLEKKGVKWLIFSGIDNVLANIADPWFVGLADSLGSQACAKSVAKISPDERAGVFALLDNRPGVVEYFELTDELRRSRNADGEYLYSQIHILCNLFSLDFVRAIAHSAGLNYHFNTASGVIKCERFIFDAFANAEIFALLEVERESEFAPLKNASGPDSIETATLAYENKFGH